MVVLSNALSNRIPAPFQAGGVRTIKCTTLLGVLGCLLLRPCALSCFVVFLLLAPALRRAGLYTVRGAAPPMDRVAVSVLSDQESDLRPRHSLVVNAQRADAGNAGAASGLELWPYLAAAAIGLLVLEWIVYCLRMRG